MSIVPTKQQHGFLKQLLRKGGTALTKDLKPAPRPAVRGPLIEAKFITAEERGRSYLFAVTETGRAWIADHPEWSPPPKPFPKPKQRLFLIQLAFMGGTATGKDLKSPLERAERLSLATQKLLEDQEGPKRSRVFTLTDSGWEWAEEHLADPANTAIERGGPAAATLQHVLIKLGAFLTSEELRLADLIRGKADASRVPMEEQPYAAPSADIEKAIEASCLSLSDGVSGKRIRLADLRRRLGAWDRATQDRALLNLMKGGQLELYDLDDPQQIGPQDLEAAFRTPSGEVRFLVYWNHRTPN